ncbi:putative GINS DNA replication complex subunit Sld5 [Aspergillus novofumigatus IBT 16806]|uniref:DNA replication complex GINS protein SLD5 n=1 Tax=Aspergillus novofumigatus (strain IBT 16806) TaxID=1392255 RepID=A0A2I1CD60_ASPN1|nr:putative GINS DNA replication complex subunit Sld5 [Aspergillus novofumigatus IBT 16806]PKX95554.1 putative GINS DNA replication complex subunit Sld5 [Aspergillus novofumigatus IBT 16806]
MDIDDILASVDRHDTSPESAALDHQLLTRLWVAERAVSELLPWPGPLMERMMERVRKQIEKIEDLAASSSDPYSTTATSTNNPTLNLKLSILQTDLARTQFLIRSFLRQRLAKLTKHSMHYLLLQSHTQTPEDSIPDPTENPDPSPLSVQEAAFLHAHQTLLAGHYGASFLNSFPPQLRRLDDNAGGTSMVQGPEMREAVVVRCLVEEVRVVIPPGDGIEEEQFGTTMRMGDVWVVRWEGSRGVGEGEVEVL